MNFEQRATIPAPREKLWDFLLNVPEVATCVPGVESVTPDEDGRYTGRMKVRVGPISLTLQGVMSIVEQDKENWRAALRGEASDRRVGGGLNATAHMTLVELGPSETEMQINADARLLGRLGEFGQPVIKKKADSMMAEFTQNVAKRFRSA
jgi:carbon monoxide dehydrogenase subunit G